MHKDSIPLIDLSNLSIMDQTEVLLHRFGEYLEQHQKNLPHVHRHSFYHIVFFTEGAGTHTIDFENFTAQPFQVYFMIPGQVHSWNFQGQVDGYVVNFTDSFFHSFLHKPDYLDTFSFFSGVAREGVINLASGDGEQVLANFEKALAQYQSEQPLKWDMIRILLLELFILIDQKKTLSLPQTLPHHHFILLKNYQKLIDKKYLTLRRPREYADLLHITPSHLNAICQEQTGQSAGELIRHRILLEAKRMLVNLDLSVTQVGYLLNFNDNSYFIKFFKKQVGLTPEDFRKMYSRT
ncbi:helix-turn-helix transcriptional regulator [Telluribacter sp. SYSU D00476]|uniref:AraC family transcriptional regulator n=1 Tax=Telluribacter sp. SYSU D00476 TaxID=2811430 RepID=UPI001FF56A9C|nr:helix-turn-helix transcriptional regulator [Telluribacter sp. SYSU D00476]